MGSIDTLAQCYGEQRTDWRPFGSARNVQHLLDNLLDNINEGIMVPFRRENLSPQFWTSMEVARGEREKLLSALSIVVIDPLSLYVQRVFDRFVLLSKCFDSEKTIIMTLTPFGLPSPLSQLNTVIKDRCTPYFDTYYRIKREEGRAEENERKRRRDGEGKSGRKESEGRARRNAKGEGKEKGGGEGGGSERREEERRSGEGEEKERRAEARAEGGTKKERKGGRERREETGEATRGAKRKERRKTAGRGSGGRAGGERGGGTKKRENERSGERGNGRQERGGRGGRVSGGRKTRGRGETGRRRGEGSEAEGTRRSGAKRRWEKGKYLQKFGKKRSLRENALDSRSQFDRKCVGIGPIHTPIPHDKASAILGVNLSDESDVKRLLRTSFGHHLRRKDSSPTTPYLRQ